MKVTLLSAALLFLFLIGCTAQRPSQQYTIQDFLETVDYTGGSFSPDNSKLLVSHNKSGIYNAYSIDIETKAETQLTNSTTNSIFVNGYFPNDERFLYTSDDGGNELNHIYVKEMSGVVTDLTPGDSLKASFAGWAQDDQSFFIATNERDQRFFDVYEYAVDGYERMMLYKNTENLNFADITADKSTIALSKTNTMTDSDIYLYDVATGETKLITEHEGEVSNRPSTFSPDGKSLYYLTDKDSEFDYLVKYDLESENVSPVLQVAWDVSYAYFSKHGAYFVVGINNDAKTELRVYDADSMQQIDLPTLENAEISSVRISRDENHMAFFASASNIPSDLFYHDFSDAGPKQLTTSLNENIDPDDLVHGQVVRFNSFDGVEIPGILYKPHQASEKNKVPALVWVHGGPGGQSRIGYSALIQYLVNHGYAIYAINNRGSSGYGKTFYKMDDRAHGEGDLDDCVTSKSMLIETGWVDENKIGIIGGSYGGYMVLAALAFRPDEFDVGVNIFGVSNWVRTLQSIPPWWESIRKALEAEMGDFDDTEYLTSISPLFHAENIQKPLLVLQGANDPRVLQVESDEIVEAVKKNGVPVEYIVFEDEGHGFAKNKNREKGYKAILDFLNTYLVSETE